MCISIIIEIHILSMSIFQILMAGVTICVTICVTYLCMKSDVCHHAINFICTAVNTAENGSFSYCFLSILNILLCKLNLKLVCCCLINSFINIDHRFR